MRVRVLSLLLWLGLLLAVDGIGMWAMPAGAAGGDAIPLRLRVGAFDPLDGAPDAPAFLTRPFAAGRPGLLLVQFTGPIRDAWYDAMREAGLEVVSYIPDYAYLVWGDAAALEPLKVHAPVRWAGPYQPYYALHPNLARPESLPAEVEVAGVGKAAVSYT
ncbi:MAG: hypothetical protein N2439_17395, partial [Anaerolineae bacterium]|nr:hypothetical protein [Anaerolineae bacterium]